MLPTVLLFGMLVALMAPPSRLGPEALGGAAAVLCWGALVAGAGPLLTGFLGGAALALPNFVVGALVGRAVRSGVRFAAGSDRRAQAS